uniref:Uncharacterized protein n=1 Tax=Anguilla anguilla TaxID=7936 RepID=A0A0E9VRM7_ANGAN
MQDNTTVCNFHNYFLLKQSKFGTNEETTDHKQNNKKGFRP